MRSRHYYSFGNHFNESFNHNGTGARELDQKNWDLLRVDSVNSPFSIENGIEEYELNCMNNKEYLDMANIMCEELDKTKAEKIVSCGIGKGILEWHIKKLRPEIKIDCTDYTEKSLEKLKTVWKNHDDFYMFDMLNGDWGMLKEYDHVILYRLSTEFNFKTWSNIFIRLKSANIKNVIFIPTELCGFKDMWAETINHFSNVIFHKQDTACGWLYSENEYHKMWKNCYRVSGYADYKKTRVYYLVLKE